MGAVDLWRSLVSAACEATPENQVEDVPQLPTGGELGRRSASPRPRLLRGTRLTQKGKCACIAVDEEGAWCFPPVEVQKSLCNCKRSAIWSSASGWDLNPCAYICPDVPWIYVLKL